VVSSMLSTPACAGQRQVHLLVSTTPATLSILAGRRPATMKSACTYNQGQDSAQWLEGSGQLHWVHSEAASTRVPGNLHFEKEKERAQPRTGVHASHPVSRQCGVATGESQQQGALQTKAPHPTNSQGR